MYIYICIYYIYIYIYIYINIYIKTAHVLVLESIWLGLKYNLFYVNVDHLFLTKVDVRLV